MFKDGSFAMPTVSMLLPAAARELLIAAARIDPTSGRGESMERRSALEHAIARVKRAYPQFFRKD